MHYVYAVIATQSKTYSANSTLLAKFKVGTCERSLFLHNSEPTQHSSCKESTAAFVLGCVEGQMSVMFAINRGDVGGGGCTKGHSWSYDSHPTCSYTTIAFPICSIATLRSLLSLLSLYYPIYVETLRSLLSNYPSTILYPTSSLRLIRPGF